MKQWVIFDSWTETEDYMNGYCYFTEFTSDFTINF